LSSSAPLRYRRFWQTAAWLAVGVVVTLSAIPDPPGVSVSILEWDKAQHAMGYAGLMWLFRQVFGRSAMWVVLLVMLGIGLEGVQALTPTRRPEFGDVVANVTGIGLGLLLAATPLGRTLAWVERQINAITERA